ncbi:MAG: hypothetical protein RIQ99_466 [Pseudomonadota bacterium]|jgi:steroid delta-isomerase-like uncharacterized protein
MDRATTLALLTRYYAAFNAADWAEMLDCLDDAVVHDINQGSSQHGKAAFGDFLAHMERCYRERLDGIVLMASNDGLRGAAEFTVHGEYLVTDEGLPEAAGQTYVLPAGAFFAIANGKITRVTVYYNLADWTAQVVG